MPAEQNTHHTRTNGLLLLLAALMILAFGLRVDTIGDFNFNWDEGYSNWIIHLPFDEMIQTTARDVHPPLYYLMLRAANVLFGEGEFALRYLSVLLSVINVALVYQLGKLVGGMWAGVLTVLLIAVARSNVDLSQLVRMHILATAFSTAAMWAAIRLWQNPRRKRAAVIYVVSLAGAMYSFYLAIMLPIATNLAFFFVWRRQGYSRQMFLSWAKLQIAAALLFLPWAIYAISRMHGWSSEQENSFLFFVQVYFIALTAGDVTDWDPYVPWTILSLMVIAVPLVWVYWRLRRSPNIGPYAKLVLMLAAVAAPMIVVFPFTLPFHNLGRPLALRYLVLVAAGFHILAACSIVVLWKRHIVLGAAAAMLIVGLSTIGLIESMEPRVLRDHYAAPARMLEAHRQPGDSVLLYNDFAWTLFEQYYDDSWVGVPNESTLNEAHANFILEPLWAQSDVVWVLESPGALVTDPNRYVRSWLQNRAVTVESWEFNENSLTAYIKTPERAGTLTDLVTDFAIPDAFANESIGLLGVELPQPRYPIGDSIFAALYWERAPQDTVSVQIVGQNIDRAFEFEVPQVAQGAIRQQIAVPTTIEFAPGKYALYLDSPQHIFLADVTLVSDIPNFIVEESDIENRLDWRMGDSIELLGYDISRTSVRPGDLVEVSLYWRANAVIDARYKVLVYTLGPWNVRNDTPLWGTHDSEPLDWRLPTNRWQPGIIIRDTHIFEILDYTAPGQYDIGVVMYGLVDGVRLPITDAQGEVIGDMATLTPIVVR